MCVLEIREVCEFGIFRDFEDEKSTCVSIYSFHTIIYTLLYILMLSVYIKTNTVWFSNCV